jgi:hypothetical protein
VPYCPQCRSEYRPGFTECADCLIPLVDELPPVPKLETREEPKLVAIYAGNPHEAAVVRSAIEGSGIPASLVREGTGSYPVTVGAIGEGRVLVRESDVAAALEIMNSVEGDQERKPRPIKAAGRPWWYWAALFIAVVFGVTILVDALRYGY